MKKWTNRFSGSRVEQTISQRHIIKTNSTVPKLGIATHQKFPRENKDRDSISLIIASSVGSRRLRPQTAKAYQLFFNLYTHTHEHAKDCVSGGRHLDVCARTTSTCSLYKIFSAVVANFVSRRTHGKRKGKREGKRWYGKMVGRSRVLFRPVIINTISSISDSQALSCRAATTFFRRFARSANLPRCNPLFVA